MSCRPEARGAAGPTYSFVGVSLAGEFGFKETVMELSLLERIKDTLTLQHGS